MGEKEPEADFPLPLWLSLTKNEIVSIALVQISHSSNITSSHQSSNQLPLNQESNHSSGNGDTSPSQGSRGWLAFGDRSRIPQSFRRARICKFSRQKRRFLQLRENRPFVVVKRLTHTQARSLKHPF